MRWIFCILLLVAPLPGLTEIWVPVRTIRAKAIITAEDIVLKSADVPGAATLAEDLIGMEARVALYPGRPVRIGDVGPPAVVDRNDIVALVFNRGGLQIVTEGRVLGRGFAGDLVRVMNLTSRTTVTGRIRPDGAIEVTQ